MRLHLDCGAVICWFLDLLNFADSDGTIRHPPAEMLVQAFCV